MALRIVRLEAQNIKGLKAIDITPPDHLVQITGANAQGKSSVLDAIWMALAGAKAVPDRPIRDGQQRAEIALDLGDFIITRSFTDPADSSKGTLRVGVKSGARDKTPQKYLDELFSNLSFDPLGFSKMPEADQMKVLLGMVDIGMDWNQWNALKKKIFDQRTDVNRQIKNLKARLQAMPPPQPDLPEKEINVLALTQELQIATAETQENNSKRQKLENLRCKGKDLCERQSELLYEKEELERKIMELDWALQQNSEAQTALRSEIKELSDPDLLSIQQRIQAAEGTNSKIRAAANYRMLESELHTSESESQGLSDDLQLHQEARDEALRRAKFPIPGLSLGEESVVYNGIPFAQLSDSEKLRISTAIAMALNPKLNVILIRDGSLLDNHSLNIIREMAAERDYQVWIECVDESGEVGIVIEAGEVKADNYRAVHAAP
jgi:chromosome segregation ATPase